MVGDVENPPPPHIYRGTALTSHPHSWHTAHVVAPGDSAVGLGSGLCRTQCSAHGPSARGRAGTPKFCQLEIPGIPKIVGAASRPCPYTGDKGNGGGWRGSVHEKGFFFSISRVSPSVGTDSPRSCLCCELCFKQNTGLMEFLRQGVKRKACYQEAIC